MPYRDRKVGTLVETGFTSTSGIKESKLGIYAKNIRRREEKEKCRKLQQQGRP